MGNHEHPGLWESGRRGHMRRDWRPGLPHPWRTSLLPENLGAPGLGLTTGPARGQGAVGGLSSVGAAGAAPRPEEPFPEADRHHPGVCCPRVSMGATLRLSTHQTTPHAAAPVGKGEATEEAKAGAAPAPLDPHPTSSWSLLHFSGSTQTQSPRRGGV